MKLRQVLQILSLATLITGCDQQFKFNEVQVACEPPKSSARYGKNQGPVILSPDEQTPFSSSLTVSGTCVDGLPLNLGGPGMDTPMSLTCTGGTFSTAVSFSTGDGTKQLTVSQDTVSGQGISDVRCFSKDTVPPRVTITGTNSAAALNTTTVRVGGQCESGLDVLIQGPQLVSPVVTSCRSGSYSADVTFTGADGLKDVVARQVDRAGNGGQDDEQYLTDLTAPVVTITSPAPNALTQSQITLTGTCEMGPRVVIEGALIGSIASADCVAGTFTAPLTLSVGDGSKNIIASQTDVAGNRGTTNRSFIKDGTAPMIRISTPAANSVTQGSITLTGTCETGLTVNLNGSGLSAATTTSCTAGAFSIPLTLATPDGTKEIIARQTDAAGNTSSDTRSFIRDSTAPVVTIDAPAANSSWRNDLSLSGRCESGLPVVITGAITVSPTTANCSGGNYLIILNLTPTDGTKNIVVTQTDLAGNTGTANRNFTRDNSGPAVAIVSPANNAYVSTTATISGTCETGLNVTINGPGLTSAVTSACSTGAFSGLVTFTTGDGNKEVRASQTDGAGNTATDTKYYIVDTTAPVVRITMPAANATYATNLVLSGTCESGLNVLINGAGAASPVTTNCAGGAFSATVNFSAGDGIKNLVATQTDTAGNTGTDNRNFNRDSSVPSVNITGPAINTVAQMGVTLIGTCETGLTVNLSGSGLASPTTTTCSAGTFSTAITFSPGEGTKNVIASQTDSVGNTGTDNRNFIKDSIAPSIAITGPAANTTAQNGVTLVGTCETGLSVNLSGSGLGGPAVTSCTGGAFSVAITFSAGDGTKNIIASQTDAAGNSASDNRNFVRDNNGPSITITAPAANTVTRTGITLVGTCENGLTVNLSGTGLASPSTTTCAAGNFSVAITFSAADGSKNIIASQTDIAGNTGSDARTFILDTTAPNIRITSPAANTTGVTGLTIAGTCETGLTVNLSGTGLSAPSTTTCSAGAFSTAITFSAGDGTKNIIASQTDSVGNTGTDNRNFIRDSTGPSLAITAPAANTIAQTGLTLVGTCEMGLTVNLSGTGLASPATTTCAGGNFSVAITFTAGDGAKNIIASQTDGAGNSASDNRTFIRDNTAPLVTITSPAVNAIVDSSATLQGTCESGLSVNISGTGLLTPVTTSCTAGSFNTNIQFTSGDGTKNIVASQTDAAGNAGSDNRNFMRDSTAPNLAITGPAANTIAQNGVTLVGTCESGLTVNLGGAGLSSPSTTACTGGNFSVAVTFSAGDGSKVITASQTDSAANTTTDSRTFIKDTTAPVVAITAPAANSYVGSSAVVSGTCESGLTVTLNGSGVQGSATTNCLSGSFSTSVNITSGDGSKIVTASQTDAAGNTGSNSRTFVRDDSAPVIAITAPAVNTATQNTLTVSGTCESGLMVNISGTGVSAASSTSCLGNTFSIAITLSAGDGTKNVIVSQTDAAGNTGSDNRNFIKDTLAPMVAITSPAANSFVSASATISGTCESGLSVVLSGAGLASSVTTTCSAAAFSTSVTFSAGDGTKNIIATQTDAAGNSGSDNRSFVRDSSAPVIAITAPAANTVAQSGLTVSGTCETGINVILSGAGINTPVTTACTASAFSAVVVFSAGDGSKVVIATQTDGSGNSASDNRTFVKDTTSPTITITSPAANTAAQTGVTLAGNCESGLVVNLSGAGLASPTSTTCPAGSFSVAITFSAGEGEKNIIASQTDAAGNTGSSNRNFVRDNTAPTITINSPAANSYVGTTAVLAGSCESGLTVSIGGTGITTTGTTPCNAGTFSTTITFTSGDGTKNVTASQTDAAGNSSSDNRNFIRDATAPSIAITAPAANTVAQTGVTVSGVCESGLSVTLNGAGVASTVTTSCTASTFSAAILFTSGDGTKTVTATQTDAAGNTGTSNRNFVRDSTAPAVAITGPAANTAAQTGVTLTGTCENAITVNLSGAGLLSPNTTPCSGGTFSVAITFSVGDGSKTIIASQTDGAGNTGSASRDFVKDTTAPAVAITAPAVNTSSATGITLVGTCETGLIVNITGAVNAPSTTACNAGAFSAAVLFSAGNGTKNIIASQTDSAGNTGSDNRNFIRNNSAGYQSFTSNGPGGKVDIIFVDDNSASMDAEQAALGSRFSSFAAALSSVDWQASIITTDCTAGSPHNFCGQMFDLAGRPANEYILTPATPNYLTVFQNTIQRPETLNCLLTASCPSGREEGLKSTIQAISLRDTANAGFFRPDADLAIVHLTDEDESSNAPPTATTPAQVVNAVRTVWGATKKFTSYAIIVRPGDTACWNAQRAQLGNNANYGTYPDQLSTLTGGISASICEPDYSLTLTQIGNDVTRVSRSVDLANTPITGTVVINYTPAYSTPFTVTGNRITFDVPAPAGTLVEIFYEY